MIHIRNDIDMFDSTSNNYGYDELAKYGKGKSMQKLYSFLRNELKAFYNNSKDAFYGFQDPINKKHCWLVNKYDFKPYGLNWDEAMTVLHAVYADCPILFFSDLYRTGGSPNEGFISPVVDSECSRGIFRRFYAEKIEEELRAIGKDIKPGTSCRDAAKKVFDYMQSSVRYDNTKGEGVFVRYTDIPSHSVLNFVRERSGVCQGFSKTYQAVMNYMSIPAVSVTVMAKSGTHSLNMLYLTDEKKWIMVDTTEGITSQKSYGFDMQKGIYSQFKKSDQSEFHMYSPAYDYIWEKFFKG